MNANDIRATANDRIATCDIYINRRAMVSHNTVVVSSIYNGRGLQLGEPNADGGQSCFITVFPKGMPTCYTPSAAAELVAEMNAHLAEQGADERVRAVPAREWWATEKEAAQSILGFLDKNKAAFERELQPNA